ncbi:hypothetical protein [Streptomyces sp. NPDC014622]|uniref:hypothetical protein n=1 Tax=Streptomyces sp. NPDC014622 TaxID=3364874 RepID=UPI0036F68D3B
MPDSFSKKTSAPAQRAADEWMRLDREEREARRELIKRRQATAQTGSRNGPVTVLRVHPAVMKAALDAANGDASRIRIVSETEVWVD